MTTKKDTNKFNFDLGLFLLITGGSANLTAWIGVFSVIDSSSSISQWIRIAVLPILGILSGIGMVFTVAVGLVYVIAKLSTLKATIRTKVRGKQRYTTTPNIRFYGAWIAVVILLIISPLLLGPFVYMTITGADTLFGVLGTKWAWGWSIGRVVAADLALAAIALVHGVHLPSNARPSAVRTTATTSTQSGTSANRTASTPIAKKETATELRLCDVPGCGLSYSWPNGKGAHFKKHHQDLVIQKGIPVQGLSGANKEK